MDGAFVDDRAVDVDVVIDAGEEVLGGKVGTGGMESGGVDDGVLTEDDAGGVGDVDDAVGIERAEDAGGRGAGDAIEDARKFTGLNERDGFVRVDIKALVVDDGVVGRVDGGQVALAIKGSATGDDLLSSGVGHELVGGQQDHCCG